MPPPPAPGDIVAVYVAAAVGGTIGLAACAAFAIYMVRREREPMVQIEPQQSHRVLRPGAPCVTEDVRRTYTHVAAPAVAQIGTNSLGITRF